MPKEFIVAIELGSSKITGIAGRKNMDGSISVLAVVKEDATACIRKGVVYNIDKTAQCLTNIVNKLKNTLKTNISQVYVGIGGQSMRSLKNVIVKDMPADTIISLPMIDELMDKNRASSYPEQEIVNAITQEYKVDNQLQLDPSGIQCSHLEGNFLNILLRKTFYKNLNKCFDQAGIPIAEIYLAPLALADAVLTEGEKRAGCVVVDLGADTTTVAVYYKNILRHLAVIPLGSNNVTKDIATLQMEESEAERLKLTYGNAFTDVAEIDSQLKLSIDNQRQINNTEFIEIVEGRTMEIIANVWAEVPNEYINKLPGGIILTGGGANMRNMIKAFRNYTRVEKIRIATFVNCSITPNDPKMLPHDGTLNTVLGLLQKGDINCAGSEIKNDLFGADGKDERSGDTRDLHRDPRSIHDTDTKGIVQTEAERLRAEEEALRLKQEQEEQERKEQEEREKQRQQEEEERRRNAPINKIGRFVKGFFKSITQEEDHI